MVKGGVDSAHGGDPEFSIRGILKIMVNVVN